MLIDPLLAYLNCKSLSLLLGSKLTHMTRYETGLFVGGWRGDYRLWNPRPGKVMKVSGSRNLMLFIDFRKHGRFFIVLLFPKKSQKVLLYTLKGDQLIAQISNCYGVPGVRYVKDGS